MDADAAPTASGPISKGDPRLRADPDRAWTPIEPGHGGEATRAQAGWLEQAEEGVGRGALLLASATFLRKLLNHHRNREKVKFYDQMLTSCVKNMRDAAAELQSWGRLLIEEHDATIHVRYLRSRTRVRAGYRTRDHEGGQFGYTWGAAEVGAALYAEHSTHCLHTVLHTCIRSLLPNNVSCSHKNYSRFPLGPGVEITRESSRSAR